MLDRLKQIAVRSLGVVMFAFIPGMAVGAATPAGWFMGGIIAVAGVYSSIIIFFGVQLAWDAKLSDTDIEKGFRAAVAKQAEDSPEVREALRVSQDDAITWEEALEYDELYGDGPNVIGDLKDLDK
jgi:hypothetical protein